MLYENADPLHLREPSGLLDTTKAVYTALDERRVRITGSTFTHHPYTIKLEGSAKIGYQTVSIVGIQDRRIMKNPEGWLNNLKKYISAKISRYHLDPASYDVGFRIYGWNAVSGSAPPEDYVPREIGIVMTVTAVTQALATRVAKLYNPYLLHFPVAENEQLPTFGFPFSPAEIERGGDL